MYTVNGGGLSTRPVRGYMQRLQTECDKCDNSGEPCTFANVSQATKEKSNDITSLGNTEQGKVLEGTVVPNIRAKHTHMWLIRVK